MVEKRMNKEELIILIQSLKISKEEYWILSSAALVLRGIYKDAGDLDIAVTKKGLDELKRNYDLKGEIDNVFYSKNYINLLSQALLQHFLWLFSLL